LACSSTMNTEVSYSYEPSADILRTTWCNTPLLQDNSSCPCLFANSKDLWRIPSSAMWCCVVW
jgi:hypothetical protein